jgi:hypothetical protein
MDTCDSLSLAGGNVSGVQMGDISVGQRMLHLEALLEDLTQGRVEPGHVLVPQGIAGGIESGLLSPHVPYRQAKKLGALDARLLILHWVRRPSFSKKIAEIERNVPNGRSRSNRGQPGLREKGSQQTRREGR